MGKYNVRCKDGVVEGKKYITPPDPKCKVTMLRERVTEF